MYFDKYKNLKIYDKQYKTQHHLQLFQKLRQKILKTCSQFEQQTKQSLNITKIKDLQEKTKVLKNIFVTEVK